MREAVSIARSRQTLGVLLTGCCFFLSGLAALIYETAWSHQLVLVFGASELAVTAVLAAYMAGLASGAALAARYADRIRRPLLLYALLELAIALTALAVPVALQLAAQLQLALLGGSGLSAAGGSGLFYLAAAFLILLLPTACMGATLPLLARQLIQQDRHIGPRIGLLYTCNTLGAAAGTLLAAFVLLPQLGLGQTVWIAVSTNLLVFLLALFLFRTSAVVATPPAPAYGTATAPPAPGQARWVLPAIMLSGFVALSYEVLWTRLLSHALGGSIYAFGTMLATFLLGISLGSAVAARLATSRTRARSGFILAQLGIAILFAIGLASTRVLPSLSEHTDFGSFRFLAVSLLWGAATLLPGAICVGAAFPFAVKLLAGDSRHAASASARVFAWNTLGAILGAVCAGYILLPGLHIAGTASALIITSIVLALLISLLQRPRLWRLSGLSLAILCLAIIFAPATPWRVLRTSPLAANPQTGEVAYFGVGRSATVMLLEQAGVLRLTTNGLPESAIQPPGARLDRFMLARWLSLLPANARPDAHAMLVIGFGAGLTLESAPASITDLHVVELEPEVIRANRSQAAWRGQDPLSETRLQVHINDARSGLLLADQQFDIIVSQPSHPWTAGAAHLFTQEFFQLVKNRLRPDGIFTQWIGLRFVDGPLLQSLVATLLAVFPHVELYEPGARNGLVLLASQTPINMDQQPSTALQGREDLRQLGVFSRDDILIARWLDTQAARKFSAGAPISTDYKNLLQIRSPRVMGDSQKLHNTDRMLSQFDVLRQEINTSADLYIIRRLLRQKALPRASIIAQSIIDPGKRQIAQALTGLAAPPRQSAQRSLWQAFNLTPEDPEVYSALLFLNRQTILQGTAPPRLLEVLRNDPAAATVIEGWRLSRLKKFQALQQLEPALAAIDSRHPLFQAALRLSIDWRQASNEKTHLQTAIKQLDSLLAIHVRPADILLRSQLAAAAGDQASTLASLFELTTLLAKQPGQRVAITRSAIRVLNTLAIPAGSRTAAIQQLRRTLSNLLHVAELTR